MTTPPAAPSAPPSAPRSRFVVAGGLAALAGVLSLAIALLGLALADGVTVVGRNSYGTEFLDPRVLYAIPLLLPLIALAAHHSARIGTLALVAATVPLGYAIEESNRRLMESGWGSGLEVLAWLIPIGFLIAGAFAVVIGGCTGHVKRRG